MSVKFLWPEKLRKKYAKGFVPAKAIEEEEIVYCIVMVGVSQTVSTVLMLLIKFVYVLMCVFSDVCLKYCVWHCIHICSFTLCVVLHPHVPLLSRSMIFAAADCLSLT